MPKTLWADWNIMAFQWPFPVATISSDYGPRPGVGKGFHDGTDFAVARGTPIPAGADGVVTSKWIHSDAGPYSIDIDHGGGIHTQYWHCDSKLVKVGQRVKQGQTIGTVGNLGLSYGPHLHFEIHAPKSPSGRSTWPARAFLAGRGVATDYAFGLTKAAQEALQEMLSELGLYDGKIDGKFAKQSVAAMQTFLIRKGLLDKNYTIDGTPGTTYGRALQTLAKEGGYQGELDGVPGDATSTALIKVADATRPAEPDFEEEDMKLQAMQVKGEAPVYAVNRLTGKKWHVPNPAYLRLLRRRGLLTEDTLVLPKNEFEFFLSLWNVVGAADSDVEKRLAEMDKTMKALATEIGSE